MPPVSRPGPSRLIPDGTSCPPSARPAVVPSASLFSAGFDDVDAAPDPGRYAQVLDAATALESVRELKDRLDKRLGASAGERILDVGCGTGDDVLRLVASVGLGGSVVGVDLSADLLEVARQRATQSEFPPAFARTDASLLPFPNATFDAAMVSRVLIHTPRPDVVLNEVVRVIRPGGRVVVFDVDADALLFSGPDLALNRTMVRVLGDSFRSGRVGRRLPALLAGAGLAVGSIEPHGVLLPYDLCVTLFRGLSSQASEDHRVTEAEIRQWWDSLEESARHGDFLAIWYGLIASGSKTAGGLAGPSRTASEEGLASAQHDDKEEV